jgi:thiol:disulfide interchange protein
MENAEANSRQTSKISAALPRRRRTVFRFRLATMLLMMIPLGVGFVWLRNYLDNRPIEWVTYSPEALKQNLRDGRTVLLSFRATWDLTGVMHEQFALEVPAVRRRIRALGVVPMRADFTDGSPEIMAALRSLVERALPTIAIYPARSPDKPIVLNGTDGWTEDHVLEALKQAR